MAGYYNNSCDDVTYDHTCDPCEDVEYGRIRSIALIEEGFEFTTETNAAEWTAGQTAGTILVIPRTNGELPAPSPKTGPGYGDEVERLLGFDFNLKFTYPNYASNCDFWNNAIGKKYKVAYRTSSKTHITPKVVTLIPMTKIDNDLNSEVNWQVECKWQHNQFACPFNTPEGVFDECFQAA